MEEQVILVDEADNEIGLMEKIKAHEEGVLHRAFSVFILNKKGEVLIQQRALTKYHSAGLWANTCCSHPRPNEDTHAAAIRRLNEEMGMKVELKEIFHFIYKSEYDNGLTEHEFDHVFIGHSDSLPVINPEEVNAYKYQSIDSLLIDITENQDDYCSWFKICFPQLCDLLKSNQA